MFEIHRGTEVCVLADRENKFATETDAHTYLTHLIETRVGSAPPNLREAVAAAFADRPGAEWTIAQA